VAVGVQWRRQDEPAPSLRRAVDPRRGRVQVLAHDLRVDPAAVRRRVSLLGHAPGLYDKLNAHENVRFAVRVALADMRTVPGPQPWQREHRRRAPDLGRT